MQIFCIDGKCQNIFFLEDSSGQQHKLHLISLKRIKLVKIVQKVIYIRS